MKELNIGDRVRVKGFGNGEIVDKLFSSCYKKFYYEVQLDESESFDTFEESKLDVIVDEPTTYCHEFQYLENVVICRFYEIKGDEKTEVARGHGHILHEATYGIAQASSYALRKIMQKLEEDLDDEED